MSDVLSGVRMNHDVCSEYVTFRRDTARPGNALRQLEDEVARLTATKPPAAPARDSVDHPPHYNAGPIEVIDAIEAWGLRFALGSAVKYIARHAHKGTPIEDLKKARWCIGREIDRLEKEATP